MLFSILSVGFVKKGAESCESDGFCFRQISSDAVKANVTCSIFKALSYFLSVSEVFPRLFLPKTLRDKQIQRMPARPVDFYGIVQYVLCITIHAL